VCGTAKFDDDISCFSWEPGVAHKRGIEVLLLSGIVIISNRDQRVVLERLEDPVDCRNNSCRSQALRTRQILPQATGKEKR